MVDKIEFFVKAPISETRYKEKVEALDSST